MKRMICVRWQCCACERWNLLEANGTTREQGTVYCSYCGNGAKRQQNHWEVAAVPDEIPNEDTLKAMEELGSGGGHRFSGSTEALFAELMEMRGLHDSGGPL